MPRGGARPNSGPDSSWKHGKTSTIRVPLAIAPQILQYARALDSGELPSPETLQTAIDLFSELLDNKKYPVNNASKVKARLREILNLLQFH